jgi:hypothetical protein
MAAETILKEVVEREEGFFYYMDDDGDICKIKMNTEGLSEEEAEKLGKPLKVLKCKIKKAQGYVYYIGPNGDLCRIKSKTSNN